MYRVAIVGAVLLATAIGTGPVMAQDEQPAPCSTEEYRQLDFWVGEWNAAWDDGEGNIVHGSNTITRELGDCMIEENFNGNPGNALEGHSISMYVPRLGHWKQIWMDNQGGFLDFSGGPDEEGFHFTMERPSEQAPHLRMVFRNITDNSFDWHWQRSQDGGETWEDSWHIQYTRAE